tara:strand:- start:94 stop:2295 length:2202 start_codon:yes stop_codon:yes gene_type:complete
MRKLFLFFFLLIFLPVEAEIVKPIYKQFKGTNLDGATEVPSPTGISISADGKKMFVVSHFDNKVYIYDLATAFDISTMDVANRTVVETNSLGDNLNTNNSNNKIKLNNDGTKVFFFSGSGQAQFHNLSTPYDVASISDSTIIDDDSIDYRTEYSSTIGNMKGFAFNNDGSKMYLSDGNSNTGNIVQVNLSTPYDPSSGTFEYNLDTKSIVGNVFTGDLAFDDDGTRLYLTKIHNNSTATPAFIYVWKLSNPFELSSATYVDKYQIDANGNNVSPYGWTFGKDGMKLYVSTEDAITGVGDDIIFEYDLICPYGVVICELNETNASIETDTASQIEFAKDVIKYNTSTIFRRFDWLRRNENSLRSYSNNINLNLSQIFSHLPDEIEKPLTNAIYSKVNALIQKNKKESKKWSFWSHGDLTIGNRDSNSLKPREIQTKGLTLGADRKFNNDKFFGLALRYGNEDTDVLRSANKFETEALSLNLYSSIKLNEKLDLNSLIGASILEIDKRESGSNTGVRNGKQIFSALSLQTNKGFTNFNIMPTAKIDFGISELAEYNQLHTSQKLLASHDLTTFETGNLTAGLKFDNLKNISNGKRSINGSFEYVNDFSSDVDYEFRNAGDSVYQSKFYNSNSIHNLKSNIGFEGILDNGYTFGFNYENFSSFEKNTFNQDSLYLKLSHVRDKHTQVALDYDPLQDKNLKFSYEYEINGIDVSINSNYDFSRKDSFNSVLNFTNKF